MLGFALVYSMLSAAEPISDCRRWGAFLGSYVFSYVMVLIGFVGVSRGEVSVKFGSATILFLLKLAVDLLCLMAFGGLLIYS